MTMQAMWVCRSCGHRHRDEDWQATTPPRACHACGSLAVTPSNDRKYDWQKAALTGLDQATESVTIEMGPNAFAGVYVPSDDDNDEDDEPEPEPEPEPEAPDVKIPDEIQVDEEGVVEKPKKRAAMKPNVTKKRRR